jgi:hypothetical protein
VLAVCVAALGDAVVAHAVSKLKSATTARLIVPCFNSGVVLIVFMLRIYAARSDRRYRASARFFNATRELHHTPSFEIAANSNDVSEAVASAFPRRR